MYLTKDIKNMFLNDQKLLLTYYYKHCKKKKKKKKNSFCHYLNNLFNF
jgi:hypothetical protein